MAEKLLKKRQHTFTWKISNFSFLTHKKGEYIESPDFIAESLDESSWCLWLYPNGDEDSKIDEMACFVKRGISGPFDIECEYKIEIIGANEKSLFRSSVDKFEKRGRGWGWDNFSKEKLSIENLHSINDTLTIQCHLISNIREQILRSENIGLTKVDTEYCSFKWVVKNLNSTCLETIKFPYTGMSQVEITIRAPDDNIEIDIKRICLTSPQFVKCRIGLLDLEGIERDSQQATHLFESEDGRNGSDAWEFPSFLKKNKLNSEKENFLCDDSFKLLCEVSVSNGGHSNGTVTSIPENKDRCDSETVDVIPRIDNFSALKSDIKRMYTGKNQTDVELIVDNKVIHAHKFILSARSPVFLAMFNQDMVEKQSGQVVISDLDSETLDNLLEFMYTGSVKEMYSEIAMKLLLAAEKYEIFTLKEECSSYLRSVLSHSNIFDVLATADLIGDKPLREASVRYIKKHSRDVLKSDSWKRFAEKNLNLATEVFCEISALFAEYNK